MLKKPSSAKTVSREASLVKRISRRPSFVKREAYLASRKINACERRDTRDERRTKRTAFLSILQECFSVRAHVQAIDVLIC